MKVCEVCGTSEGNISGKSGKYEMDLCMACRARLDRENGIRSKVNKDNKCEICGNSSAKMSNKYHIYLCSTHNLQMKNHGKIKKAHKYPNSNLIIKKIEAMANNIHELPVSQIDFWGKVKEFRRKFNVPQSAIAKLLGVSLEYYTSNEITPPRKEYHIPHVTTDDEEYNALSRQTKKVVDSYPDELKPKVSAAKAHNDAREMVVETLEMCIGNYANDKISRCDYTRWIPGFIESGIVEQCFPEHYRLTEKFAEPM